MKKLLLLTFIAFMAITTSCKTSGEPDVPPVDTEMNFVHSVLVGNNAFISLFKDLDVKETNTTNAIIHSSSSYVVAHKKNIFVIEPMDGKLYKYRQENGELVTAGTTLLLSAGSYPISLIFASDSKAYIPCAMSGELVIINPETMEKTGIIDLSSYAIGGDTDISPEPTTGIIRDDILYVCLAQDKAMYQPHAGSHIVLINVKTDAVIKTISDDRATMSSGYYPFLAPVIDEKGDIYIYNVGGFGSALEGFLRINKGEQDFDPDYYFSIRSINIPNVAGNASDYIYTKVYAESGIVYGYLNIPANYTDMENPMNNKTMQPFKIDLYNKSITKLDFQASLMAATGLCVSGDNVVFGMESQGAGYSVYNYKTDSYENVKIKTQGTPFEIKSLSN